jgi:hypothetical protein
VEFNPQNSFWDDFESLNKYVARVQSFLQKGKPDNDILLYFPIFDRYSDYGRDLLEHFDAVSPRFNGTPFRTATDDMLNKGYGFDYISDLQLNNTNIIDGLLKTTGGSYKTLIVPGCKYIPLETFEKVLKLAETGADVIFLGDMPENIAGWADNINKGKSFSDLKASLKFSSTGNDDVKKAVYGKGSIYIGKNLEQLLSTAAISRERMVDYSIKFNRRKYENGYYYFVVNKGTTTFDGWLPLGRKASSVVLFNPMTGELGASKTRVGSDGLTEVYSQFKPEESLILETSDKPISGNPYIFYEAASASIEITGSWKVSFIKGGPTLPATREIAKLISWTEFGGEDVKDFSGTATYSINFKNPAEKSEKWTINLGKVCESARISLNGREVAVLIGPDYQTIIDTKELKANNTLEIKVSNLPINRIAYTDRNKIPWKIFYNINMSGRLRQSTKNGIFDASDLLPRESGLIGPVTIAPLLYKK